MLPNFQTHQLYIALFLRANAVMDYKQFSESLPWRLPEFDAQPRLSNAPPNAPPDTPRVLFASKDHRMTMELSASRVGFRMLPGNLTGEGNQLQLQALPVPQAFDVVIPQALRVHGTLSEHYGMTANRVGVLTEIIAPVGSSANQRIHRSILGGKNSFGERLHEIQIQALARTTLGGDIGVNRIIRVSGLRQGEGGPDSALSVHVDINTLPEQNYDLSTKDLSDFLTGVRDHLDTQVPLLTDNSLFE